MDINIEKTLIVFIPVEQPTKSIILGREMSRFLPTVGKNLHLLN